MRPAGSSHPGTLWRWPATYDERLDNVGRAVVSRRAVAVIGGGATFVLAAVAGVLGNQLRAGAWWPWLAFLAVLVIGAVVTAVVAYRTTDADSAANTHEGSAVHVGNATVGKVSTKNGPAVGINYGTVNDDPKPDRH